MEASVVDLRYKMKDVLRALDRNESVTVLYRGKVKGILIPSVQKKSVKIIEHPFFGMDAQNNDKPVSDDLDELRKFRYDDI